MESRESSDRAYYEYEARKLQDFLRATGAKVLNGLRLDEGRTGGQFGYRSQEWGTADADRVIADALKGKRWTAEEYLTAMNLLGPGQTLNAFMADYERNKDKSE